MEGAICLKQVIDQVVKEKGIDRHVVIDALEQAALAAANKKFRFSRDLEARYNEELGEIEVFEFVTVVDEVVDSYREIDLAEAREEDPEVELGDSIGMKLESALFSRVAAQNAKQVIFQKVREAEGETAYREYIGRVGEIVNGIVRRAEHGGLIVDLGRCEAILPRSEQSQREIYRQGDRIKALISAVNMTSRGAEVVLSRASADFVVRLLKDEVPELDAGEIEVAAIAREAGSRTKIAVSGHGGGDPVAACIGSRGARIQSVVSELRGERIDVIAWSADAAKLACAALAPATVSKVFVDQNANTLEAVVADDQLALAIGKGGQNVKLAAQLTGWKISVTSEAQLAEATLKSLTSGDNTPN